MYHSLLNALANLPALNSFACIILSFRAVFSSAVRVLPSKLYSITSNCILVLSSIRDNASSNILYTFTLVRQYIYTYLPGFPSGIALMYFLNILKCFMGSLSIEYMFLINQIQRDFWNFQVALSDFHITRQFRESILTCLNNCFSWISIVVAGFLFLFSVYIYINQRGNIPV